MVTALNSGSHGLGWSLSLGHCVLFLVKSLNSQSASLHPGVQCINGYLLFECGGNPAMD